MSEPTVFFVQEPGSDRDFSSANRYGKVEFLLSSRDRPGLSPGPTLFKLRQGLRKMRPGDYLAWAGGDPLGPTLVGLVLAEMGFRSFNMLRWERERDTEGRRTNRGYYVPVTIDLR